MLSLVKHAAEPQTTIEEILCMVIALQQDILRRKTTEEPSKSSEPGENTHESSCDARETITMLFNAVQNHSVTAEEPNADTHATILLLINEAYRKILQV